MSIKSEIETVLNAHAAWRENFKDILNGRAAFDLSKISATDKCFFGNWLENEGKRMIPADLHTEISAVHKEFHSKAAEIIQKIKEKRFAEARKDIELDGVLNLLSMRLKSLVLKIKFKESAKGSGLPLQEEPLPSVLKPENTDRPE